MARSIGNLLLATVVGVALTIGLEFHPAAAFALAAVLDLGLELRDNR